MHDMDAEDLCILNGRGMVVILLILLIPLSRRRDRLLDLSTCL